MTTKTCKKCKRELPATTEYFYKQIGGKLELRGTCKECEVKKRKIRMKKYYEKNKEEISRYQKEYRENNVDKIKQYHKKYKVAKPIKIKRFTIKQIKVFSNQKSIAKRNNLERELTISDWEDIKLKFENKCAYCGRELKLEMEHVIPVSKGGGFTINNIIPTCKQCNINKKDKNIIRWYRNKEFYSKEREDKILNKLSEKELKLILKEFEEGENIRKKIKKLKTRKEQECNKCRLKINSGEYAFRVVYSYDGVKTEYYCTNCME